jgi:hypothetical protein
MSMVEREYFEELSDDEPEDEDDGGIIGKAYVTINEAADFARCHPATIRRAIAARRLAVCKPNGKHGRSLIKTADLWSWLDRSRISAVGEG